MPLERQILDLLADHRRAGTSQVHGFGLAQAMGEGASGRLIGHGTLYKALGRLEDMGLLSSQWEADPPDGRPRRRLYELTATGAAAALTPSDEPAADRLPTRIAPRTA